MLASTHSNPAECAARALAARDRVGEMTAQEKTDLLSGFGMWKTARLERFGVEPIVMTDGTYGVRYSISQIDGDQRGGRRFG